MKNKKTVVITGGKGLLGSRLTSYLFNLNYFVIIIDLGRRDSNLSKNIGYIEFDLTNIKKYNDLVVKISSMTDNLYGLINNAAYNPKIEGGLNFGDYENLDLDEWNNEVALNLSSPVFLVKSLLPIFNRKDNQYCKIVNVVSTYGIVPPNQNIYKNLSIKTGSIILKPVAYPVTKAGLLMFTKYLATYPGCKGININAIAPGGIENGQDQVFIDSYSKNTPMERMANVDEMMETFGLLLSDKSNYIQGQVIAVDGGWTSW
jgi:NAD(P)-dependent dehydrogenase (short-subunit alcohol dehydrogenase family)